MHCRCGGKRLVLNQHFEAKHMRCIVKDGLHAKGSKGIRAAGLAGAVEAQCGKDSIIGSLVNQQGGLIEEPEEIGKTFQGHFGQLSFLNGGEEGSDGADSMLDLMDFLAVLLHLLGLDAECCEGSVTPEEVTEALVDCGVG